MVNLGDKHKGNLVLFRIVPCLLFIAIVGFRNYTVGVDSESYRTLYYAIPNQDYVWIEIGFDRLIRIFDSFHCEYNVLFLVSISLTAIPIFIVLEKSESYTLSAFMMYTLTLITVMNGMRQCIAVGWFVLGSLFIKERKSIPFFLCMGVALLFHYSCIILFPLYFIINKKLDNKVYTIIYVVSFVFCFVNPITYVSSFTDFISILGRDFTDHTLIGSKGLSIWGFIYNSTINVLIYYTMLKFKAFEKNPVWANCVFASFVLKNISFNMPIVGRMIMYFDWLQFLLIPLMINQSRVDNKAKAIYRVSIIFLFLIGFVYNIFSVVMKMVPYEYCLKLFI